ncbi:MAG: hypothetical protein JSW20_03445 [Nitrospiraceae bacterium]|nr:MAG: hypothetical protein JSW20_03445 [Nitrospiraceae bacterium]
MRLAIFTAFPQELKPLLRKYKIDKQLKYDALRVFFSHIASHTIIFVQTGMGQAHQERACKYIVEEHRPECILSIGFGGALFSYAEVGELVWGTKLILFPEDTERYRLSNGNIEGKHMLEIPDEEEIFRRLSGEINITRGSVITLKKPSKKSLVKEALPRELSSPVCDMETFILAKYSLQSGLPFYSIRAVTDRLDEDIPLELFSVVDREGNYNMARALKLLVFKPRLIPEAIKLGRHAGIAAENLSQAVTVLINIMTTA